MHVNKSFYKICFLNNLLPPLHDSLPSLYSKHLFRISSIDTVLTSWFFVRTIDSRFKSLHRSLNTNYLFFFRTSNNSPIATAITITIPTIIRTVASIEDVSFSRGDG